MGKKEQVPALAIFVNVCGSYVHSRRRTADRVCDEFVEGSLWVWSSATSRGRPPDVPMRDGGLALAVFHMVPRVPAAPNLFVHPPAKVKRKKENGQPKGGMGERHAATTQGF